MFKANCFCVNSTILPKNTNRKWRHF